MKSIGLFGVVLIGLALTFSIAGGRVRAQEDDQLRTPPRDSAERKAILDAVHAEYKEGADQPAKFTVNYLKVHHGWAWINVTPLDANGKQVADPAPLLFHKKDEKWVSKELFGIGDADDQVGPLEPSPSYIAALQKKYPGLPADIIPRKH